MGLAAYYVKYGQQSRRGHRYQCFRGRHPQDDARSTSRVRLSATTARSSAPGTVNQQRLVQALGQERPALFAVACRLGHALYVHRAGTSRALRERQVRTPSSRDSRRRVGALKRRCCSGYLDMKEKLVLTCNRCSTRLNDRNPAGQAPETPRKRGLVQMTPAGLHARPHAGQRTALFWTRGA